MLKITQLKEYLFDHFQTEDLWRLRYFHSIEGIVVSQRKYALCILEEIGMTNSRPIDSPMDPNQKLMANQGKYPKRYRGLVGKLIYLTITRPNVVNGGWRFIAESQKSAIKIRRMT